MSACPFCQTPMQALSTDGLTREECDACGALWLEGESLAQALGGTHLDALLQRAKGRPGQCKGCEAELRYVPGCPSCGRQAPACPRCGDAPLPVVDVRGVAVDVCVKCRGMALDVGELQQLQQEAEVARAHKHENASLDLHPKVKLGVTPACTKCRRKMRPEHGFVWDERLYCGSCAPEGSVPYTDELTKAHPSEESSLAGTYGGVLGDAAGGPSQSALSWLLSKLIS